MDHNELHALLTYGYSGGGSVADLTGYVEAGLLIMDIRYNPRSRVPQWNQEALRKMLGIDYEWCRALGNRNYKGAGGVELLDWQAGWARLEKRLRERPVVLLCACNEWILCHRATVCQRAKEAVPNLRVEHLKHQQGVEVISET